MKNLRNLLLLALVFGVTMQCAKKGIGRDLNEIRTLVDSVWNKGDVSLLDKYIAPDVVRRAPGQPDFKGIESYRTAVQNFRTAFPDLRMEFVDTVIEGESSASHWVMSGTHKGVLRMDTGAEIPPTGKRMAMQGVTFIKWKNGMIVEEFAVTDTLGAFQQLGLIPSP